MLEGLLFDRLLVPPETDVQVTGGPVTLIMFQIATRP
jgi:hypothetical protein